MTYPGFVADIDDDIDEYQKRQSSPQEGKCTEVFPKPTIKNRYQEEKYSSRKSDIRVDTELFCHRIDDIWSDIITDFLLSYSW